MSKNKHAARALSGLKTINDQAAVLGFLAFLVMVIFLLDSAADHKALQAGSEQSIGPEVADSIISKLTINSPEEDGVAFIVKDTIDPNLFNHFASMDYEKVKEHLGIDSDFVIHFEDEQGMIILIGKKLCIGSRNAMINGIPCG